MKNQIINFHSNWMENSKILAGEEFKFKNEWISELFFKNGVFRLIARIQAAEPQDRLPDAPLFPPPQMNECGRFAFWLLWD